MKRLIIAATLVLTAIAAQAQVYGGGNTKVGSGTRNTKNYGNNVVTTYTNTDKVNTQTKKLSGWNDGVISVNYTAQTEFADKGMFGWGVHYFGNYWGFSYRWDGVYDLGSKKFMETLIQHVGPNFNVPFNDNAILFAPLCLTVSSLPDSKKIYWGASFIPSLGLRVGNFFLSGGWEILYDFKASEFNTKNFTVSIGYASL